MHIWKYILKRADNHRKYNDHSILSGQGIPELTNWSRPTGWRCGHSDGRINAHTTHACSGGVIC